MVPDDVETEEVNLREYQVEPCNCCYSTTSGQCNFPCTCYPFDPMQDLYPKLLRSDILLCSTGVNQATMHTRLKAFCDRMVCLDGGFFLDADQFPVKDQAFKGKMQAIEASGQFAYDQRLYGRVAGYFIASKDETQPLPQVNATPDPKFKDVGYLELTAHVLKDGMESYGYFHADPYFAGFAAPPNAPMMYDKAALQRDSGALERAQQVVRAALALARRLRVALPPYQLDRRNRT